ncbi:OmpA family protein [Hyphomonas sp.]|uniref:OmpA family protein n=1 Tax=Hyphomonas sp. TaxID=87 RepID=UPI0025C39600|nr:OmpA family protein [Hyphomonas sp.]
MRLSSSEPLQASVRTVRRFRRASADGLAFVPYGLLPLLGLGLLTVIVWTSFAPHSIESSVRQSAEEAVADTGAEWAKVEVSGQWVTVRGTPPTPEAGERLLNAIRTARAPTWLGSARPATRVRGNFGGVASARPDLAGSDGTVVPGSGTPEFLFRLSGPKLTLEGRVPDIATRDALIAEANNERPAHVEEVVSHIETLGVASPAGFQETALRGVDVLKQCDSGTVSLTSKRFNVRCALPQSEADRVRALASRTLPYGSIGDVEILAQEVVETCEEELARLLEASRIEFDPGSDLITSSKAALLDLTARAATDCPGRLRVEGHTDNTGSAALNESLSKRRAEAVRAALIQRGVAPSRILAAGYGASKPIGDNTTDEGRALNRRIEIRIVKADE